MSADGGPSQPSSQPCPYKTLPDHAYWRRAVAGTPMAAVDPITATKFTISRTDKIATAGSCFAQHIARFLAQSGYEYFVTEPGHELIGPEASRRYNYGVFSARYGNIYTTRQLLQLLQRAYGLFEPADDVWVESAGVVRDPYRPQIQPVGFSSLAEFEADRAAHFAAVRRMVEEMDVFIFTLGLTEAWRSKIDGAVYPVCPGCGAGRHDAGRHEFVNFTADEVAGDLEQAIAFIEARNPNVRILLSVSPVPLIATYEPRHVLVSTTYSKSVLRVAAEQVMRSGPRIDYFPSYEIITGNFTAGAYYDADLREIEEQGVHHAMSCFYRHYLGEELAPLETAARTAETSPEARGGLVNGNERNAKVAEVVCDEEFLDNSKN